MLKTPEKFDYDLEVKDVVITKRVISLWFEPIGYNYLSPAGVPSTDWHIYRDEQTMRDLEISSLDKVNIRALSNKLRDYGTEFNYTPSVVRFWEDVTLKYEINGINRSTKFPDKVRNFYRNPTILRLQPNQTIYTRKYPEWARMQDLEDKQIGLNISSEDRDWVPKDLRKIAVYNFGVAPTKYGGQPRILVSAFPFLEGDIVIRSR